MAAVLIGRSGRGSGGAGGAGGRLVHRPIFTRVLLGIFVAFGVWWVIAEAAGPHPARALHTALWLLAVTAALACLFWRPAVVVDDTGVELRNVLRDVRVPWAALDAVETRYTLTLHCGERRYQSWAGAAPGRPSVATQLGLGGAPTPTRSDHALPDPRWTAGGGSAAPASSRDLRADSGATAFMIEQRWNSWRERAGTGTGTGTSTGTGPPETVLVWWRPVLPGVSVAAAALALAVAPLIG
jgi:hypothetical protein